MERLRPELDPIRLKNKQNCKKLYQMKKNLIQILENNKFLMNHNFNWIRPQGIGYSRFFGQQNMNFEYKLKYFSLLIFSRKLIIAD
ncbi:hypothetical protein pb186bvf_007849 [Paramecium bursaria]